MPDEALTTASAPMWERNDSKRREGHPARWFGRPVEEFDPFPEGGGYPKQRFMQWAYSTLGVTDPDQVLHMCAGSVRVGITVDVRDSYAPDIVADCRAIPLPDASIRWIMADPPYSREYAERLYGTGDKYPTPSQIIKEAGRLLVPGGRFGLLHPVVPGPRKSYRMRLVGVWGITTGTDYAIRAWSVFEKAHHPEEIVDA
jgi:hypothetical protein